MKYSLLEGIEYPADLKKLSLEELPTVCSELRNFIIDEISRNPGHFGASLGVVELTVAMHYAFNTPYDKLIWDVGHQAYGHKILTGRRKDFHTNRKLNGLCGFPNPLESKFDAFGVGHSSTSISAALGMAVAAQKKGETDKNVVAIIGDGSLTGGLAFEALNNAGVENTNLLVVLNDNNMSIDPNVGAMNQYLLDITTSKTYNRFRADVAKGLRSLSKYGPNAEKLVRKVEHAFKSAILKESNFFEAMRFRYFGPVDGHDVTHLARLFEDLKDIKGPKVLHVITQKGKGFALAEKDQTRWHAPGCFNKDTGEILKPVKSDPEPPKYQDVFGKTLVQLAEKDDRIVGVTPAMISGSSMNFMLERFPDRVFDVGIAEQHAVTFSAGMAADGLRPFCNIYSTFMQRAFDQVIHDVALQKLPVVFCLDRAGLVGQDGATHHGFLDIPFMRVIPDIVVAAPLNEHELRNMMLTASKYDEGPFSIRYPRGKGVMVEWENSMEELPIGKGRMLKEGSDVALLSIGHIGNAVMSAASKLESFGVSAAVYDMRFVKPIDDELLTEVFKNFDAVVTVEDGFLNGGFGSAVLEFMADNSYTAKIKRIGIPDKFIEHGKPEELHVICGFDVDGIVTSVTDFVSASKDVRHAL